MIIINLVNFEVKWTFFKMHYLLVRSYTVYLQLYFNVFQILMKQGTHKNFSLRNKKKEKIICGVHISIIKVLLVKHVCKQNLV